ncbi:MAG: cupin domain-containing protein [Rickettsiales bacterium]|jgi:quercetin dioxygenase-like cupin family protein
MPVVKLENVPKEDFPSGATYQTIVGDDEGTTPVRVGVQISPPGYSTGTHSHPYMEIVCVIEGEGEAWIEGQGDRIAIGPGTNLVLPPNTPHGFKATGSVPLKTYGVHASPQRIVER